MGELTRKPISWKRLFLRHWLWAPVFPLIFALVFGVVGIVFLSQANRMAREGVDTVATITDRTIRSERDRDGNSRTRYVLRYTFAPTSDQRVEGVQDVGSRLYNSVRVGQEVPVRYVPDDPGLNALEPPGRAMPLIFLALALIGAAAGLGSGFVLLRNKLSLIRAARHGQVLEARVTSHEVTNTTVNGRTQYRFGWLDAAGNPGRSAMTDFRDLPAVGAVVTVYVDPRSGRGWWDGDF